MAGKTGGETETQPDRADMHVLVIGDTGRDEFRDAAEWLERNATVSAALSVGQAAGILSSLSEPPTGIVVAQAFPGQFTTEQVERLRRLAPLTPVMGLLGSWCEGEMRSGRPAPGMTRDYWHCWRPRAEDDWRRLTDGHCPLWGLPTTVTEDERWLRRSRVALTSRTGLTVVRADTLDTATALMEACREGGYSAVWLGAVPSTAIQGAAACLWDVGAFGPPKLVEARDLRRQLGLVPLVAVMGFPRIDDRRQLLREGIAAVVSKPYLIDDLLWQLNRVAAVEQR